MGITLSGHQLKALLDFCNPDGENDKDQLDTEVSIEYVKDGHSGTGYYFYITDYPEEGSLILPDEFGNYDDYTES